MSIKTFIILSGCSCSGKTSLFNILKKDLNVKKTYSEFGSRVINQRIQEGRFLPWEYQSSLESWRGFEKEIYDLEIKELEICKTSFDDYTNEFILFDRSLVDISAYYKLYLNKDINEDSLFPFTDIKYLFSQNKNRYEIKYNVFILKPLSFLQDNLIRNMTFDESKRMKEYEYLNESYRKYFSEDELNIEENIQDINQRINWIKDAIFR